MGVVVGEVIAMGIFFNLTRDWTPYYAFGLVGLVGAALGVICLFLVKEPILRSVKPNKKEP